jgi:phospholipid/cholesterol/gamma-HCH transport system substrate-binding protein
MNRRVRDSLVGLFILAGLVLAVWAYFWFSGRIERGRRRMVTVVFPSVSGLRAGDPVQVLGIEEGKVTGVALERDRVKVSVALRHGVRLTEGTKFAVRSMSYLGSDRYLLVTPGPGPEVTATEFEGTNEALDLEETFLRLDRMLSNLDAGRLTDELRQARDELMGTLRSSLSGLATDFSKSAREIENISAHVDTLAAMLAKDAPAGKLLSSSELYDEVRQTNLELKALIADIKANPDRYVKVKVSLFGRN